MASALASVDACRRLYVEKPLYAHYLFMLDYLEGNHAMR